MDEEKKVLLLKYVKEKFIEIFLLIAFYVLVFLLGASFGLIAGTTAGSLLAWDRYFPYVVDLFLH